jgi:hypothetical protein
MEELATMFPRLRQQKVTDENYADLRDELGHAVASQILAELGRHGERLPPSTRRVMRRAATTILVLLMDEIAEAK